MTNQPTNAQFLETATRVLTLESEAVTEQISLLDHHFTDACQSILDCKGKVIVTGMGKSGHIGSKLAATLASTGTPSFFVHPGEASHGDLGMIHHDDVVIALSNSGETSELTSILPLIKRKNCPLITITSNPDSTMAKLAWHPITVKVSQEACPNNLAPTSSTTAALAVSDALAVTVLQARGFTAEDFALSHPGGSLGKKLLLTVEDVMAPKGEISLVDESQSIGETLMAITQKGLGIAVILNDANHIVGVFTDGDLRRSLDQRKTPDDAIDEVMTKNPSTINQNELAAGALKLMEDKAINAIPVVNDDNEIVGVVTMHMIIKAGLV